MSELLKYVPITLVAASLVASAATSQFQIAANADDLTDLSESVDENEDTIEEIQRVLIRRQGEVELNLQQIKSKQDRQADDLSEIIRLLKESQNGD